jgi:hypothetical protein
MSEHRPGPWVAEFAVPPGGTWPAEIATLGYGVWVREECGIPDDVPSEEECQANARLIAAAPDLLAVAEEVLSGATIETPRALLRLATAAIAKATT